MTTTDYMTTLDEAFGTPSEKWPEWLRLSTPREQLLLARAIDAPDTLSDSEWQEFGAGPCVCGVYNAKGNVVGVPVIIAAASVAILGFVVNMPVLPFVAAIVLGILVLVMTYWRARYWLRLRRARRERAHRIGGPSA